jgi:DUF1680 family protein
MRIATSAVAFAALLVTSGNVAMAQEEKPIERLTPVPFTSVRIDDAFWAPRLETNRTVTIPHDFRMCEETGRIGNFAKAGGLVPGEFQGIHYDDSDVYKVIEGASHSLATHPDAPLGEYLDDLIAKIAKAQQPDGYLYTFHTLKDPSKRYSDLKDGHELYCAGHLIEAAVAHHRATGKRNLLDVATRLADHIDSMFGEGKRHGIDGHEEIELALFKLADLTGEGRYRKLGEYFVRERGRGSGGRPLWGAYYQDHKPAVDATEVTGHAVRQAYLLCAMADLAAATGDRAVVAALDRLFDDLVTTKMYITGGIGSRHDGEAFGESYELPNETAYAETCAAIGNALWNHRMNLLHRHGRYADVVERVLYNGFLSGVSLTGDKFFYVNPLASRGGHHRKAWYGTACCPVNVVRFLPSLPGYVYATGDSGLYVNLYAAGEANLTVKGTKLDVRQETRYPWDGTVRLTLTPERPGPFSVFLRIPEWCEHPTYRVNGQRIKDVVITDGYLPVRVVWQRGDTIELDLPMPVRRVKADPRVKANVGRVALQRGPVVYCAEAVDHGGRVDDLILPEDAELDVEHRPDLLGGLTVITGAAQRRTKDGTIPVKLKAIPYYAWDHREPGQMAVWLAEDPSVAVVAPDPTIANRSRVAASHCWANDTPEALNDGVEPNNSADQSIPRFTWWDRRGTAEWVQYEFPSRQRVSGVEVYWFDDQPAGGQCRVPNSWKVLYRRGDRWLPVEDPSAYARAKDAFNRTTFKPVETDAIRVEVQLGDNVSAGILELKVAE